MRFDSGVTDYRESDFNELLKAIGVGNDDAEGTVSLRGMPPVLPSPLRIIEAGTQALAAQGAAVSALSRLRNDVIQDVVIDTRDVVFALNPFPYFRRNGRLSQLFTRIDAASCGGHFEGADGRFIYMANISQKGREATLRFFNAVDDRAAVARAIASWDLVELEDAMVAVGIPAAVVRTREDWRGLVHGNALLQSPLVRVAKFGDCEPVVLPRADQPLAGIRVLDMTHVVAGPMMTRALAGYGAEVLHLSTLRPDIQDAPEVTMEALIGKRSAQIELDDPKDRATLEELIRTADVFVQSWRPGVLARFGFTSERIAELNPAIVQVSLSCYGNVGPWRDRGGFDGLALASIGATFQEAERDRVKLSPPDVLTDSLVGFLGAGLIASLLRRRALEGGGYKADLSLARIGMWLQSLGEVPVDTPVTTRLGAPRTRRLHSCFGAIDYVAPAVRLSGVAKHRLRPPEPVGSSPPRWYQSAASTGCRDLGGG